MRLVRMGKDLRGQHTGFSFKDAPMFLQSVTVRKHSPRKPFFKKKGPMQCEVYFKNVLQHQSESAAFAWASEKWEKMPSFIFCSCDLHFGNKNLQASMLPRHQYRTLLKASHWLVTSPSASETTYRWFLTDCLCPRPNMRESQIISLSRKIKRWKIKLGLLVCFV